MYGVNGHESDANLDQMAYLEGSGALSPSIDEDCYRTAEHFAGLQVLCFCCMKGRHAVLAHSYIPS
jgi:hypothetical protein